MSTKLDTTTKFTSLRQKDRNDFMNRWYKLKTIINKWAPEQTAGEVIPVFGNKKDLEKEIEDLENVSLSAYRAMKSLKEVLSKVVINNKCVCGKDLTSGYIEVSEQRYCNQVCLVAHSKSRNNSEAIYNCGNCGVRLDDGFISIYGRHFCDNHCLTTWETDYEPANYCG